MEEQVPLNECEEAEPEPKPRAFVFHANSFVGRHVSTVLSDNDYEVYGDSVSRSPFPPPEFCGEKQYDECPFDEAFESSVVFVFDVRESPETVMQLLPRLETVQTPVKVVIISTLMTWALTQTNSPLTGDDFRKRKPHPNFRHQYEAELMATKIGRENPNVEVFVLSCGILYGDGEDTLFQLFKFAWGHKFNASMDARNVQARLGIPLIGDGENIVPMMHVRDLAQLMMATLQGKMIDKYVMGVDKGNHRLKDIIEAIAKTFSDGKTYICTPDHSMTIPWISEEMLDYFTSNIIAVNELLGRVTTNYADGFVASIQAVKNEFIQVRGVSPLRILICGPPLSGKSYVASRIAYRYSLPLITADSIVAEAKKNEDNSWDQFASLLDGEISPSLLLDLLKKKLQDVSCCNQGFVLDGIPSNADFAEALWSEGNNWPEVFVELECGDHFLRERAKKDPSMLLGIGASDEFDNRISQYRATNPPDDSHLFHVFDPQKIRAITFNVEKTEKKIVPLISTFIGRPHNFGKSPTLILKDTEELNRQKRLKQEKIEKMEKELKEAAEAKRRAKEIQIQKQQEEIEQEETRLLAKYSRPQREYLVSTVAPTLAEGLCYLIEEMPANPIQLLGCFIGSKLTPEQQAELMKEFQPEEEEEEEEYEEEEGEEVD